MVKIEHTITAASIGLESQLGSLMEHLRYSGSRVKKWSLENGKLRLICVYQGTAHGWKMIKARADSFMVSIEDEHRYHDDSGSYRLSPEDNADLIRQCLKCSHIWNPRDHLRKSGEVALRCPSCNSNQTADTKFIITKIQKREDLLLFTDGQYPEKFMPKTSMEETQGILLDQVGKARLSIGRGFENPKHGHKIILSNKNGHQMDTCYEERQSMKGAVAWCPEKARVFIGGLGLGLILLNLAKTGKAREVIVCEIDPDVINLVEPRLRAWLDQHHPTFKWKVIEGDALVEVKKTDPYDWIFMDLWKSAYDTKAIKKAEAAAKENLTENGRVTCWMKSKNEKMNRRLRRQ